MVRLYTWYEDRHVHGIFRLETLNINRPANSMVRLYSWYTDTDLEKGSMFLRSRILLCKCSSILFWEYIHTYNTYKVGNLGMFEENFQYKSQNLQAIDEHLPQISDFEKGSSESGILRTLFSRYVKTDLWMLFSEYFLYLV